MVHYNRWMLLVVWMVLSLVLTGTWNVATPGFLDVLPSSTHTRLGVSMAAAGVCLFSTVRLGTWISQRRSRR
jgi:hypothetical protein